MSVLTNSMLNLASGSAMDLEEEKKEKVLFIVFYNNGFPSRKGSSLVIAKTNVIGLGLYSAFPPFLSPCALAYLLRTQSLHSFFFSLNLVHCLVAYCTLFFFLRGKKCAAHSSRFCLADENKQAKGNAK